MKVRGWSLDLLGHHVTMHLLMPESIYASMQIDGVYRVEVVCVV